MTKLLLAQLSGKKTYLVAGLMLLYQVLGHYLYQTPYDPTAILSALGLATLRAGVAKSGPPQGP